MLLVNNGSILLAGFEIGAGSVPGANFSVVLESKNGQRRNTDYYKALEVLLSILGINDCQILEIQLASTVAMKAPVSERILPIAYPITLSSASDFENLRRCIWRSQAQTLTRAKTGSGNSHRKIRIEVLSQRTGTDVFGSSPFCAY